MKSYVVSLSHTSLQDNPILYTLSADSLVDGAERLREYLIDDFDSLEDDDDFVIQMRTDLPKATVELDEEFNRVELILNNDESYLIIEVTKI